MLKFYYVLVDFINHFTYSFKILCMHKNKQENDS